MMKYGIRLTAVKRIGTTLLLCLSSLVLMVQGQERSRPNIIVIYADDVGYGDIGAYGAELISTPNIDQLATEGVLFTDAYATASTCTPSRYSLLTGEYAFRNDRAQILSGEAPLLIEPGRATLPSVLRDAGYRTSVIGKWHLGLGEGKIDWNGMVKPGPLEIGFDESFIIPATTDRVPTVYVKDHYVYGLEEKDKPLRVSYQKKIGDLPTGESNPEMLRYSADPQHSGTIVNEISRIGWMEGGESGWWTDQQLSFTFAERSQNFIQANKDNPFFLFLSLHENHVPRAPHPRFKGMSKTGLRGDAIVELDWIVGQVISILNDIDLRKETLILFTSDNGPIFNDGYNDGSIENANEHPAAGPFRGGKYNVFEGGTRIPFIVSWPGQIKKDITSSALISQVDLLATFVELTGSHLPKDAGSDSHNLLSVLLGRNEQGREFVVQQGYGQHFFGIRHGSWKLIPAASNRPGFLERKHNARPNPLSTPQADTGNYLFNLEKDPGEATNVADEYPEIVQELTDLLERLRHDPEALPRSSIQN